MADARDLAAALSFIAHHAETPNIAVHMVAAMIDGVAGWTELTPLNVETEDGQCLTSVDGVAVHLHNMLER
jgi:hypothetical protein